MQGEDAAAPDDGTAYGRPPPEPDRHLTAVGAGTAMGELLRRYWHPVGLAADAGGVPKRVRVLGEELILFRDGDGNPGLLYPRCMHRGSSLYYGKVEARGLRCCYHGWLFDHQGHCLEQPLEAGGGSAGARARSRQPWYPLEERYGLIFAYLGPPERKPLLPRYDALESLGDGEFIEADDTSLGSGGGAIVPCNWLQHFENVMDPLHVPILHGSFSGPQFVELMGAMPKVSFEVTGRGLKSIQARALEDGRTFRRVTEAVLPTLRVVANPRVADFGPVEAIGWVLPMDDDHFRIYVAGRVREAGELGRQRSRFNGKLWADLSEAEHQQYPGNWEAQVSQGPITAHSEEHLAASDRGVNMLRQLFRRQLKVVADGGDPLGTCFDAAATLVTLEAGNYAED